MTDTTTEVDTSDLDLLNDDSYHITCPRCVPHGPTPLLTKVKTLCGHIKIYKGDQGPASRDRTTCAECRRIANAGTCPRCGWRGNVLP